MNQSIMSDLNNTLDIALLQKHGVRLYGRDIDTYDIINEFLEDNRSEQAFYVVDLGELTHSVNQWQTLLPLVKPYYAIKCNPNHVMLETLAALGVNFDCASENEIKTIIEITGDPTRIIFGGDTIAKINDYVPTDAKVLMLFGGESARKNGTLAEVREALGAREIH
jgi:hypothetical protein